MKKFLLSATFLFVFAAYALYQSFGGSSATYNATANTVARSAASQPLASNSTAAGSSPPPSAPAPTQTLAQTSVPSQPSGQYIDGTYTGPVVNAYYGYVQVQATVSNGRISDVQFLQYPNDRSTSRYINSQAMPILASEAVQAQSASVDGVSGASDTSAAFEQSLSSALGQAKRSV